MFRRTRRLALAALVGAGAGATAVAAQTPTGVWIDHTGRGAVEITECGPSLCGRIVWIKDAGNNEGCGIQVIGNVKPVAGGKWDNGWILDPEKNSKYDVELTPMGDKLKVLGYAGSKFLSETMMWTRASPSLPRCDRTAQGTPAPAPAPTAAPEPAAKADPPPEERAEPGKKAGKECKIDLGFATVILPCD
jgi:uncharacterized protein (DUF2147 family)